MMLLGRSTSIKIIVVGLDFIKRISSELHGVTEKICQLFVSHCRICQLKKSRKSIKSFVVKPIASSSYLSRGQVDLIDFSTVSPEDNAPYKWLLVYQDHFTKFVRLRALVNKCAEEVANTLMDFFCDLGAPLILIPMHVFCGRSNGEEGFGAGVYGVKSVYRSRKVGIQIYSQSV